MKSPLCVLTNRVAMVTLLLTIAMNASSATLAEKLGYGPNDKCLIINGDDAGMCHAANTATIESLQKGLMTTATIMTPCPWFSEIAEFAKKNPQIDFGIHLTHTSEWKYYRWGTVASRDRVPGLLDPDGYLWRSVEQVYANAKPQEAYIEGKAQIDKALAAGIDVTHIDSHMGTMQLRPDFLEIYLQLAVEYKLPARMASQDTFVRFGQPEMRNKFTSKGILFPDYFVYEELKDESKDVKQFWMKILANLKPGVTELYIHATHPTDEIKPISGSWPTRAAEFETFTNDPDVRRLISDQKIIRVGYRALRELQRKSKSSE